MPIVIPTRDEVAKMTSRDREKWRNRLGVTHDQVRDTKDMLRFDTDTALDAHWWLMRWSLLSTGHAQSRTRTPEAR